MQLDDLVQADSIAQGQQSQSIMNAIGDREKQLRVITGKLLEPEPGSLRAKLEALREFAVSRLSKIRELLALLKTSRRRMRRLPSGIGQLTLEAMNENEKKTYRAHGKVDFFGEEELAHSDGAGGPGCSVLPQAKFLVELAA